MRKLYVLLLLTLTGTYAFGQISSALMGSCLNSNDEIEIRWNSNLQCPTEGSFAGITAAGFESGTDDFTGTTVSWNDGAAFTATNNGMDTFEVTVGTDYYGLTDWATVMNIRFVFNQGVDVPADPWALVGRDTIPGGFGCEDLIINPADLASCASMDTSTGIGDLLPEIAFLDIFPNPAQDGINVNFQHPGNGELAISISNMTGQIVRRIDGVITDRVFVERGDIPSGIYLLNVENKEGKVASRKVLFH